jgi:hypothetical protein
VMIMAPGLRIGGDAKAASRKQVRELIEYLLDERPVRECFRTSMQFERVFAADYAQWQSAGTWVLRPAAEMEVVRESGRSGWRWRRRGRRTGRRWRKSSRVARRAADGDADVGAPATRRRADHRDPTGAGGAAVLAVVWRGRVAQHRPVVRGVLPRDRRAAGDGGVAGDAVVPRGTRAVAGADRGAGAAVHERRFRWIRSARMGG